MRIEHKSFPASSSIPFLKRTKIVLTPVACFSRSFSRKFRAEPSIEEYSTKRKGAFPHRECANSSNDFWTLQESFFSEVYTKEGYEWISYYLYEIPLLEEKAKKKGKSTNDGWAKYENGDRIDLSSDEALWNFLENNFSSLKKNCSAINN